MPGLNTNYLNLIRIFDLVNNKVFLNNNTYNQITSTNIIILYT